MGVASPKLPAGPALARIGFIGRGEGAAEPGLLILLATVCLALYRPAPATVDNHRAWRPSALFAPPIQQLLEGHSSHHTDRQQMTDAQEGCSALTITGWLDHRHLFHRRHIHIRDEPNQVTIHTQKDSAVKNLQFLVREFCSP